MKKQVLVCLMLLVFALLSMTLTGCQGAPGLTSQEVHRRHVDTFQNDIWQMQDDFDAIMMIDRPARQSKWMVR
ncbi:MAG: hypothetical protein ACYTET_01020 [Planctomycetota bacterium]|jgi:hypothetical protein